MNGVEDFIVTPEVRHVFLEVNAGGEWFWLQRNPALSIADARAHGYGAARELHLTFFSGQNWPSLKHHIGWWVLMTAGIDHSSNCFAKVEELLSKVNTSVELEVI